jgi:type IV fimbrial biogenesis protein FimT
MSSAGRRGFTLVELIVTISVVAILAAIALPSFGNSMRNSRVTTQTNDLLAAINLARSESVTRTRGIAVCAADTSAGLPAACGDATDWSKGWVVFMDATAGDTAPTTIAAANVLRTWVAAPKTTIASDTNFLRFNARGESVFLTTDKVLTIVPSDTCTGQQHRTITVSPMGRASSTREDCP